MPVRNVHTSGTCHIGRRAFAITPLLATALSAAIFIGGCDRSPSTPNSSAANASTASISLGAAMQLLQRGRLDDAEQMAKALLVRDPKDADALVLMAGIAAARGEVDRALEIYESIPATVGRSALDARKRAFDLLQASNRPFDAALVGERLLEQWPDERNVRTALASFYASMGLGFDSGRHWYPLLGQRPFDGPQLLQLSDSSFPAMDLQASNRLLLKSPNDLRPGYVAVRNAMIRSKWEEVRRLSKPIVDKHPQFVPAVVALGRSLFELGDTQSLGQWAGDLPQAVDKDPDYWVLAGQLAQAQSDHPTAARAFWESCKLDPLSRESQSQLCTELASLGREEDAQRAWERQRRVLAFHNEIHAAAEMEFNNAAILFAAAKALESLGAIREAKGWGELAKKAAKEPVDGLDAWLATIAARAAVTKPRFAPTGNSPSELDLSDLPLPNWSDIQDASPDATASGDALASQDAALPALTLVDQAPSSGLSFTYQPALAPLRFDSWIWQSMGGGAAAVDIDLDGWTDLYFSQAGGRPMVEDSPASNELWLNRSGKRWVQVTASAGLIEKAYTHGVSFGDFNEDGHPDLLSANIGKVNLYRNNGDGTFTDVSQAAGLTDASWASGAVLADLDQDGHVDLYIANYVDGNTPFDTQCYDNGQKRVISCVPWMFKPKVDRVYRGRGDGTFELVTDAWLDGSVDGRGIGLAVANLDGKPGLEVFVANDVGANNLWTSARDGDAFKLKDIGGVRGVAVDHRGHVQGCMGIAIADSDRDGDLDLFITNYEREANAYYVQTQPGRFEDQIRQAGLVGASKPMLGWGTQWVDFNLDGWHELVVANGHLQDETVAGGKWKMPTQVFARTQKQYVQLPAPSLGDPYFARGAISRGANLIDWNRDGRMDVVIVQHFEPATLISATGTAQGHYVQLSLVATEGHREAIGAEATAYCGEQKHYAQITAGDGCYGSNQRIIHFGLGDATAIDRLEIRWPNGATETLDGLPVDRHLLIVQHRGKHHVFSP
jgi:tetratricopeptide (TPR) repeat protein